MPKPKESRKDSIWVRAIPMMLLVVLGAAFALYGRLVRVETKLVALKKSVAALEKDVGEIHAKLIPTKVADHR